MIDMKKFYLTSLAALLLVSCGNTQHKSSNEEVEDSVSLNIEVPESKSIATMSEDECKEAVTDFFASHFGKLSKIKKWTDFGKWENNKAAISISEICRKIILPLYGASAASERLHRQVNKQSL